MSNNNETDGFSSGFNDDFFRQDDYFRPPDNFNRNVSTMMILTITIPLVLFVCCAGVGYCIYRNYQKNKQMRAEAHNPDRLPAFPTTTPITPVANSDNHFQQLQQQLPAYPTSNLQTNNLVTPVFPVAQEPDMPVHAYQGSMYR